ncbi:MAG: hypothetical protein AAGH68_00945 [Pseudomonadota bacterium]
MRNLLAIALLSTTIVNSAQAATDQPLPPPALEALVVAETPGDIAELVLTHPEVAPTLLFEAALLGVASPAQVIARVPCEVPPGIRVELIRAGSEAVPAEADILVAEAHRNCGGQPAQQATAAILGVQDAGTPRELVRSEAFEIAAVLTGLAPASAQLIYSALANATTDSEDTAELYAAGPGNSALETADIADDGLPDVGLPEVPFVSPLGPPDGQQNNPSPN